MIWNSKVIKVFFEDMNKFSSFSKRITSFGYFLHQQLKLSSNSANYISHWLISEFDANILKTK
jgi:hypothetical protein